MANHLLRKLAVSTASAALGLGYVINSGESWKRGVYFSKIDPNGTLDCYSLPK